MAGMTATAPLRSRPLMLAAITRPAPSVFSVFDPRASGFRFAPSAFEITPASSAPSSSSISRSSSAARSGRHTMLYVCVFGAKEGGGWWVDGWMGGWVWVWLCVLVCVSGAG
jgi:hypothetical protein